MREYSLLCKRGYYTVLSMILCLSVFTIGCQEKKVNYEAELVELTFFMEDVTKKDSLMAISNTIYPTSSHLFVELKSNANWKKIIPHFTLSPGATSDIQSGVCIDGTKDSSFTITVTAENAAYTRTYKIKFLEGLPFIYPFFDFEKWGHFGIGKDEYVIPKGGWSSGNVGVSIAKSIFQKPDIFPARQGKPQQGQYSALLTTEFLGFGITRIAAGAYFLGQFDDTHVIDDPLSCTQFGVDWPYADSIPERFQGWYQYQAGSELCDADGKPLHQRDEFSIFAVFFTGPPLTGHNVEISDSIIAIAWVPDEGDVSTFQYFDIPFEYKRKLPKNTTLRYSIILSSSRKGDRFIGAVGSQLLVDELRITSKPLP